REYHSGETLAIEPALVDTLLEQMQAHGQMTGDPGSPPADAPTQATPSAGGHIETAFLQLVLSRIWTATRDAGSRTLSLQTLNDMGGALTIVNTHVKRVMDGLNDRERE